MTLLEMVQNILSAMNSDEVNSISDTVESQQVAEEVRNTFFELYGNRDLGAFESLVNLSSPGDVTAPHILTVPDNVQFVKWIKYRDLRADNISYVDIQYLSPEDFINRVVEQATTLGGNFMNITLTPGSTVQFPISTDRVPRYYTVLLDSESIVFDSFDQSNESHLTASNSLAWGSLYKDFTLSDDFVAPIDDNFFPHFLAEAKSACFVTIKEVANSKEEQRARRQLIRTQTRTGRAEGQWKGCFADNDYSRKR